MKKLTRLVIMAALLPAVMPHMLYAQVPLDCSGADCGSAQVPANNEAQGVQLPGNGSMPSAGEAGSAPGGPVSGGTAPSTPATDPVAPVTPPSP